ncbi:hypothetical protein VCHENC02_1573, partial [Vibrio harveyi]
HSMMFTSCRKIDTIKTTHRRQSPFCHVTLWRQWYDSS